MSCAASAITEQKLVCSSFFKTREQSGGDVLGGRHDLKCLGDCLSAPPAAPPSEQATAHKDQARKATTGDGPGDGGGGAHYIKCAQRPPSVKMKMDKRCPYLNRLKQDATSPYGLCNAAHWGPVAARENRGPITQHYEPVRVKFSILLVF